MGKRNRKQISSKLRFEILKRDGFKCVYCGIPSSKTQIHIDHVKPFSSGGGCDIKNLVTSCSTCNQGKQDVSLEDNSYLKIKSIINNINEHSIITYSDVDMDDLKRTIDFDTVRLLHDKESIERSIVILKQSLVQLENIS